MDDLLGKIYAESNHEHAVVGCLMRISNIAETDFIIESYVCCLIKRCTYAKLNAHVKIRHIHTLLAEKLLFGFFVLTSKTEAKVRSNMRIQRDVACDVNIVLKDNRNFNPI